jgi:hypothetical protein
MQNCSGKMEIRKLAGTKQACVSLTFPEVNSSINIQHLKKNLPVGPWMFFPDPYIMSDSTF